MSHNVKTVVTEGLRRYSVAHFLVALVLLLGLMPFLDQVRGGRLIESAFLTVVLLSAVLAVGGRRQTLIVGSVLVIPSVIGRWMDHIFRDSGSSTFTAVVSLVFLLFVMLHLFHFILRAPRVNSEVLCAGVAGYLLLGILWGTGFHLLERLDPGSFSFSTPGLDGGLNGFNTYYYSFVCLTTLGFGEITPVSKVAKMLTQGETIIGMFYFAILLSRLVALYSSDKTAA